MGPMAELWLQMLVYNDSLKNPRVEIFKNRLFQDLTQWKYRVEYAEFHCANAESISPRKWWVISIFQIVGFFISRHFLCYWIKHDVLGTRDYCQCICIIIWSRIWSRNRRKTDQMQKTHIWKLFCDICSPYFGFPDMSTLQNIQLFYIELDCA